MKISGAQLLAEMLAGYEVSHVFMVPARRFTASIAMVKKRPPIWPMATRARPESPASAWRKWSAR
jgi:hypothetical protein